MTKRKHSLVDLTASPPFPPPLTSRPLAPRADSHSSARSSRSGSSRGYSKHTHKAKADVSQPATGFSQEAIDVDADDNAGTESIPVAGPSNPCPARSTSSPPSSQLLAAYTCPICFSGVTNACLTPCGHVLCGACLFAAVKSGIQRALSTGMIVGSEGAAAKCPVCRAMLKGWDGKGGGIIPLKMRTIVAL